MAIHRDPNCFFSAVNLGCWFDQRVLFSHLSMCLTTGDIVEIHGSNGSGKSTLLRMLAGLQTPQQGCIQRLEASIGWCSHKHGLSESLTVEENLRWLLKLQEIKYDAERLASALSTVNLMSQKDALVGSLSEGQKQRAALARLVLSDSRVWLLDEPQSALDEDGVKRLRAVICAHIARGGAAVIAIHGSMRIDATQHVRLGND